MKHEPKSRLTVESRNLSRHIGSHKVSLRRNRYRSVHEGKLLFSYLPAVVKIVVQNFILVEFSFLENHVPARSLKCHFIFVLYHDTSLNYNLSPRKP